MAATRRCKFCDQDVPCQNSGGYINYCGRCTQNCCDACKVVDDGQKVCPSCKQRSDEYVLPEFLLGDEHEDK